MPQLRSFNSYAPAPQLAQAYAAGTGLAQRDEELLQKTQSEQAQRATQYAIAEMETATRRQALAQEAVQRAQALDAQKAQFDMNLAAQKEQLKQEAMMKEQELEVDKFYKTGMLGVNQRKATSEANKFDIDAKEAARSYAEQLAQQKEVDALVEKGVPPQEAWNTTALRHAPAMSPSVQAKITGNPNEARYPVPTGMDIFGKPTGNVRLTLQELNRVAPTLPDQVRTNAPVTSLLKLSGGAPAPEPNQAAINHLLDNPKLADQFDAKYGKGASQKYLR